MQAELPSPQRGGNARRSTADNQDVYSIDGLPGAGLGLEATGDLINGASSLIDPVADQGHAAQFSHDENAGEGTFEVLVEEGNIRPRLDIAQAHDDRANRADLFTVRVSDALGGVDQMGGSLDNRQHAFRADPNTTAAADTLVRIDMRMLTQRLVGADALGFAPFVQPLAVVPAAGAKFLRTQEQRRIVKQTRHGHRQRPVHGVCSFGNAAVPSPVFCRSSAIRS